jgi:hypothetical protein
MLSLQRLKPPNPKWLKILLRFKFSSVFDDQMPIETPSYVAINVAKARNFPLDCKRP